MIVTGKTQTALRSKHMFSFCIAEKCKTFQSSGKCAKQQNYCQYCIQIRTNDFDKNKHTSIEFIIVHVKLRHHFPLPVVRAFDLPPPVLIIAPMFSTLLADWSLAADAAAAASNLAQGDWPRPVLNTRDKCQHIHLPNSPLDNSVWKKDILDQTLTFVTFTGDRVERHLGSDIAICYIHRRKVKAITFTAVERKLCPFS